MELALPISMRAVGVLFACALSGCSGSLSPTQGAVDQGSGSSTPDSLEPPQGTVAINGRILIQENKGKRVFDAYFTDTLSSPGFGAQLWREENQACYTATGSAMTGAEGGTTTSIDTTYLAGSSIDIHAREGKYLSLEPQTLGNTVVYTSDIRWTDMSLPQDALLSVANSQWFPEGVGLALYPLLPIERIVPENGILLGQESAVLWESGDSLTDRIQVVFTVPYEYSASDDRSMIRLNRVYCDVRDNGSFDLPNDVRNAVGNPDTLHVSLSRRRTSELMHEGSALSVLQISNDQ